MAQRRWQVPAAVAAAARDAEASSTIESERYRDLSRLTPVGPDTLFALVVSQQAGSDVPDGVGAWARRLYGQSVAAAAASAAETLVAAEFDPNGLAPEAYGLLDPDYEGDRICAVLRASSQPGCEVDRWGPDGWEPVAGSSPVGLPYTTLTGELLADALVAAGSDASLILSPSQPRGFVSVKEELPVLAAAEVTDAPSGGVYAVTDPLDTSAIVVLFTATTGQNGPVVQVRRAGEWAPDDGTLLGQLRSISPPPVISVPPDQVSAVCRQVDDYDATHPQTANHPTGGQAPQATALVAASADPADHSRDVMIALPVPQSTARGLAAHDGVTEDPAGMHITLAYLGDKNDCPPADQLMSVVREWAAGVPTLNGQLSGGGMFNGGESGPIAVALPDLPDLPHHRQRLIGMLRNAGMKGLDHDHGYTPHITLAYGADRQIQPPSTALSFPGVGLYYGDETAYVPFGSDMPLVAATHASEAEKTAHAADVSFDRERAEADQVEQARRRAFEERLGHRYDELCSEGTDPDIAAGTVRREMQAEDDRRALWERDRTDALAAEKARRLAARVELVDALPIAADAAPHTAMPRQLLDYWTRGKGAAKIRWGTSGDYNRAVRYLAKYMDLYRAKAAANELHRISTGLWPAQHAKLVRKAEGRK